MNRYYILIYADDAPGILYPDHPAIALEVHGTTTQLAQTQDGSFLNVVVQNHLPCVCHTAVAAFIVGLIFAQQVSIDSIRVVLVGTESERMVFSGAETSLTPGSNVVEVSCTVGIFPILRSIR
jgi:trafficking protein particle complex subunit 10